MDDFYSDIGSRIKKRRLELGFTREKLASMAFLSDKFLYDIETGKKGISAKTLYKLKKVLDVSADWLLEGNKGEDD